MDIPRIFNITESAHRIHNPFTPDQYATLGAALRLSAGARGWTWAAVRGRSVYVGARSRHRRHGRRHEPPVHRAGPKPCGGVGRGRSGRLHPWRCATSPTPANTWAGACSRSWRAEVGDGAEKVAAHCLRPGLRGTGKKKPTPKSWFVMSGISGDAEAIFELDWACLLGPPRSPAPCAVCE